MDDGIELSDVTAGKLRFLQNLPQRTTKLLSFLKLMPANQASVFSKLFSRVEEDFSEAHQRHLPLEMPR